MNRSFRAWSAVMSCWYLVLVSSLVRYPPGDESGVVVGRGRRQVPEHVTFFQVLFGVWFYVAMFAVIACGLLVSAACAPGWLWRVHLASMVLVYPVGIGYVVYGFVTDTAYSLGAAILAGATSHILIAKLRTALMIGGELGSAR